MSETATVHPLIAQLVSRHGLRALAADEVESFCANGVRLLVFMEDPLRYRETLDLAVIAPELARAFPDAFTMAVLFPEEARRAAAGFAFRRWPALVMTRDGACIGAIDGLRDWDEYLQEIARLLTAPAQRAPSVAIRVVTQPATRQE